MDAAYCVLHSKECQEGNEVTLVRIAFISDQGKVRRVNEDAGGIFLHPHGYYLVVVADGMGGHRAGEVASTMAVEKMQDLWLNAPELSRPIDAEEWLLSSIEKINKELYEHAEQHIDCEGMGTTIVVAICTQDFITLGNVGDSRGYIFFEDRTRQITEDHSFVNALVQSGEISKQDAEHHPKKNLLLKSLGSKGQIKPNIYTITIEDRNIILLCSDGLANKTDERLMTEIVMNDVSSLDQRARHLVDVANEHGGEDNITIALVEFDLIVESEGVE